MHKNVFNENCSILNPYSSRFSYSQNPENMQPHSGNSNDNETLLYSCIPILLSSWALNKTLELACIYWLLITFSPITDRVQRLGEYNGYLLTN